MRQSCQDLHTNREILVHRLLVGTPSCSVDTFMRTHPISNTIYRCVAACCSVKWDPCRVRIAHFLSVQFWLEQCTHYLFGTSRGTRQRW
jgi:hypothetical protein